MPQLREFDGLFVGKSCEERSQSLQYEGTIGRTLRAEVMMKVFLNAPIAALGDRLINERIVEIIKEVGWEVYAPHIEVPIGTKLSAEGILRANEIAVEEADLVLSVLDRAGTGVAYELGYARHAKKPIIALRTDSQNYLGKILEGLWDSLPEDRKATDFDSLRRSLRRVFRPLVKG